MGCAWLLDPSWGIDNSHHLRHFLIPRLLAMAARRDDDNDLFGCEKFTQGVRTVAFIGNESIKMERGEQRFSLGEVMGVQRRSG